MFLPLLHPKPLVMVTALQLSASSLSILHSNGNGVAKPSSLLSRNKSRLVPSKSLISNSHYPQNYHLSPPPQLPPLNQSVAAVVFGDGSLDSTRLYPLTVRRSESAIPIAANYRLIDVVVSNCINSNIINKIYVLTQFNSTSLNSHLVKAYSGLGCGGGGFLEVVADYQSLEHQGWFQGSADAIRRCLWVMEEYTFSEFLILPGHHLYKMDYRKLIEAHRKSNADITIAAASPTHSPTNGGGYLEVDSKNQVTDFHVGSRVSQEKPRKWNGMSETGSGTLYENMGIYVINREMLRKLVNESFPEALDLGSEVIKGAISTGLEVHAYVFNGYWEDMGSISAFYRANLECISTSNTCYGFYDMGSPLYGIPRCLPPTTVSGAVITESVIGDGCILKKCRIKRSVMGMRSRIGDRAVIEDSVILGSDIYHEYDMNIGAKEIDVPIGIGDDTLIMKAIVDKNARIGRNVKVINKNKVEEANRESEGYVIRDGIIVILRGAEIPDNTVL
ncbi:Inactive glucose-1-phosphate adenylyltransferase small subunit 2, chloroplastic [Linum perenne]